MTDSLYEGYKDALRRGHVATARGRLETAVGAYREAARLAPDRSLAYVGLGTALARLERVDEALAAFRAALDRAPDDEKALLGRADLLASTDRPAEAAAALDRLAEVLERGDRLADACDAARRALELAESRGRRRLVEALVTRLSTASEDPAAASALERARRIIDVHAVATPVTSSDPGVAATPADDAQPLGTVIDSDPAPGSDRLATVDPLRHRRAFEAAIDAGNIEAARREAVAAANAHRAVGAFNASIDACYEALAVAPGDPAIHFALTQLYLDRGWRTLAADKLVLIGRLAEMSGDRATLARLCDLAARRFPDDARLSAMCLTET
jgi:tetratricopeptide (TPR) repeat protein